jgi:hypothetical protein
MVQAPGHIAKTLEEALVALKHDPSRPVHACVDNLEVELRVVGKHEMGLGAFMAEGGEEILHILREGRAAGTSGEPPKL